MRLLNRVIISKDHLPSLQDGRPYRQTFYYSQNSGQEHHGNQNMFLIVFAVAVAIILLLRFLCYDCRKDAEAHEAAGGDRVGQPQQQQQLESNEAGGGWVDRAPASTVAGAAVEMAPPVQTAEPPLLCTYRKADGWREGSCGVCLVDLDDGEAVRVLPACMHYFHAACVGEWLRIHATCPLCRAPLVAPADATT